MLIFSCILDSSGWSPVHQLVSLAARVLQAEIITADRRSPAFASRLATMLRRRERGRADRESCLFICQGPSDLMRLATIDGWRHRFDFLAAWIIDSFWLEHIPRSIRWARPFDRFFVTSSEDVDRWRKLTGVPVTWLPWGSDVLNQGSCRPDRPWDLTRVGRQPAQWNDDCSAAEAARLHGIAYRGRVPGSTLTALQNQQVMMRVYGETKFILAFSNAANPEVYTHPTREYLTGRWVDALAAGAVVAGIAPRGADARALLWPGATLELDDISRNRGLEIIAEAVRSWNPETAQRNFRLALERLDWRWRLEVIAGHIGGATPVLRAELDRLRALMRTEPSAP